MIRGRAREYYAAQIKKRLVVRCFTLKSLFRKPTPQGSSTGSVVTYSVWLETGVYFVVDFFFSSFHFFYWWNKCTSGKLIDSGGIRTGDIQFETQRSGPFGYRGLSLRPLPLFRVPWALVFRNWSLPGNGIRGGYVQSIRFLIRLHSCLYLA